MLTPEEGCGLSKVKTTRVLGGADAPAGKGDEQFLYSNKLLEIKTKMRIVCIICNFRGLALDRHFGLPTQR